MPPTPLLPGLGGPSGLLQSSLQALRLALPAISQKITEPLPSNSPLRSLFNHTIPQLFLRAITESVKQIEKHQKVVNLIKNLAKSKHLERVPIPLRRDISRKLRRIYSQSGGYTQQRSSYHTTNNSAGTRSSRGQSDATTIPTTTTRPRIQNRRIQSQSNNKTTHTNPLLQSNRRQFTTTTSKKLPSSSLTRNHTKKSKLPISTSSSPSYQSKSNPLIQSKRYSKFQFKRYAERTRWSHFHHFSDIFSPIRTLYNWLRPVQWKFRRLMPGKFAGYFAWILTGCAYTWMIIWAFERNRQFDSGWVNPELSNWGYFTKRDWANAAPMYDVEIFRKRKRYQKMDGNRFLHEEDLKVEMLRPKRWKWMHHKHIDRFGQARGVWPLRSYVINSPQYVDRRYLSRGYEHRRDKFGKWVKHFGDYRNTRRQKKRALRLRGGKYEYGGTAHQYWFTKTLDEDRFTKVPSMHIPEHAVTARDAGKY